MPTRVEAPVNRHDREIAAIRKLILTGMKLLNQIQVEIKKVGVEQQITEKKLRGLIDTLRSAGAGGDCKRIIAECSVRGKRGR